MSVVDRAKKWFAGQRERRSWLDHVITAYRVYQDSHGNHLAAAITYFSVLALFPLALLGVSILGFVLAGHQHLYLQTLAKVESSAPGGIKKTVATIVASASANRSSLGIVGVLGVAYAGIGWISNLRTAVQDIWRLQPPTENFAAAKLRDLLALIGLGVAIVVSLALTSTGTSATGVITRALHIENITGMGALTRVIGIVIAIAGDVLIFSWVLVKLPRTKVPFSEILKGALFAAVGFEILKAAGSFYIARVTKSPSAAVLGGIIGLLVFVNLVSRFVLFSTAWTTTLPRLAGLAADTAGETAEEPPRDIIAAGNPSGAKIAAALLGLGGVFGAAAHARVQRRRRAVLDATFGADPAARAPNRDEWQRG